MTIFARTFLSSVSFIAAAENVPDLGSIGADVIAKGGVGAIAAYLIYWVTGVLSKKIDALSEKIEKSAEATTKLGEHVNKLGDSIKDMNGKSFE